MQVQWKTAVVALLVSAAPIAAQELSVEGHASYARGTQTHSNSWGAGAQFAQTWGGKSAPVQLGTSEGFDWMQQENSGPTTKSVGVDAILQPGGGGAFTPYAGVNASENWMSGTGAPSGAQVGFEYIVGAQLKLEAQGPLALHAEVRPGYVKTQEHTVTYRFGVSYSLK